VEAGELIRSDAEAALPRLLLADDDPATLALMEMSLKPGFEIVAAVSDAASAIELARRHQPDVALIDVNMPEGGARHAVPGIVEVSPHTAIVLLSADESDSLVRELVIAGAIAYCRKGTKSSELAAALHRAIVARANEQRDTPDEPA
jgi:DNA-binding NarL/FixJ family response regulator